MNRIIERVPLPIAGLMLALAVLGNLLSSYGLVYRNILGAMAAFVLILIVTKVITDTNCILEGSKNPLVASVVPTFSMGLMVLSTYIRPYSVAYGLWLLSLALHIALILHFTKTYVWRFNIENVFPSYFVVFVGIVVGSVTAPVYQMASVGQILFWFGFMANLALIPIIFYRLLVIKKIPEGALPTFIILAAPTSLCLVGYLNSFSEKNTALVIFLVALSLLMLVIAFLQLPRLVKLQFYPSYSAFTFPFVISAMAMKGVASYFLTIGWNLPVLKLAGNFLELWAVVIVVYVAVRYTKYLFSTGQSLPAGMAKGLNTSSEFER